MEMLKVFTQGIFGPTYYMQSEGFSDRLKTALRGNKSGLHIPFASCHLHGKILPLCR